MKKYYFLVIGFLFIFSALFAIYYRQLIFPPLHRYLLSPKQLLPESATSSLDIIEHGPRDKPNIALTFDADMTPGMKLLLDTGIIKSLYNRDIKKILDKNNVKATIFLGGLWTQTYPAEAKDLAKDPLIEIGNHSYNHYAFANNCYSLPMLTGKATDDVREAQNIIQKVTGVTPKYFRFPGGCYENISLESVAELGLTVVHWNITSNDGFNNDTGAIVRQTEAGVQNGSILIFHIHDGSYAPKTADALIRIIPDLKAKGFKFVTISGLLNKE